MKNQEHCQIVSIPRDEAVEWCKELILIAEIVVCIDTPNDDGETEQPPEGPRWHVDCSEYNCRWGIKASATKHFDQKHSYVRCTV